MGSMHTPAPRLSWSALDGLRARTQRDPRITLPAYEPADVTAGIVHFGVGGFHRAHEAVVIDDILSGDPAWGICGIGVREADRPMRDALAPQDGLYTLTTVDPSGGTATRVIGSIVRYLHAPDGRQDVLEAIADPKVRIVSLTVTEGGYGVDDATGDFAPTDAATQNDLDPDKPAVSTFGLIADGIALRCRRGLPGLALVSCDNIQDNGAVTRIALTAMMSARHPQLVDWLDANVSTPSSMVDRITPQTPESLTDEITAAYGVGDQWPVRAETYLQWVLEDDFPNGAPDWTAGGVQLAKDVGPYEQMKLRLLNAAHQVMTYPALLAGMEWVHEAARDPDVSALTRGWFAEARATLPPVPGVNLDAYGESVITRFGSEAVRDTLARQALGTSDKLPKFVVPVVAENLAAGREPRVGAFVLAAWSLWLAACARENSIVEDQRADALLAAAAAEDAGDSGALLRISEIFGEIGENERLRELYLTARNEIDQYGVREAGRRLLDR